LNILREPLTISLYDGDKSIDEAFINENKHFMLLFKPYTNMIFSGYITYFDNSTRLAYVRIKDENHSYVERLMAALNSYFELNEYSFCIDDYKRLEDRNETFCARYSDNKWYRVRTIRVMPSKKVRKQKIFILIKTLLKGNVFFLSL
jgi:hypothetical protein